MSRLGGFQNWLSRKILPLFDECEKGGISHTVDGSDIRRSPVEVGRLSTSIYDGFQKRPRWLLGISEPSIVCFHVIYAACQFLKWDSTSTFIASQLVHFWIS